MIIKQGYPTKNYFTRVNKENKKRDKSQKQDLSRCVAGAGLEPATFGL